MSLVRQVHAFEMEMENKLTKSKLGIRPQINSADVVHMSTMSGTIIMNNDSRSLTRYALLT